jgi:hypothetical protein
MSLCRKSKARVGGSGGAGKRRRRHRAGHRGVARGRGVVRILPLSQAGRRAATSPPPSSGNSLPPCPLWRLRGGRVRLGRLG